MQNKTIIMPHVLALLSGAMPKLNFVDITSLMLTPEHPADFMQEVPHDTLQLTHRETGARAMIWLRYDNFRFNSKLVDPTMALKSVVNWLKTVELVFPDYILEKNYQNYGNNFCWMSNNEAYRIFDSAEDPDRSDAGLYFGHELKSTTSAEEEKYHLMAEFMLFAMATAGRHVPHYLSSSVPENVLKTAADGKYRMTLDLGEGLSLYISPNEIPRQGPTYSHPMQHLFDATTGFVILFGKPHHFRFNCRVVHNPETLVALIPKELMEKAAKDKLKEVFPFVWAANDEKLDFVWVQKQQ